MLALIFLLCAGFTDSFIATAGLRSYAKISGPCNKRSALYLSSEKIDKNLWDDNVEYVDLNANNVEPSETSRTLPLFLLGGAFYPAGKTQLKVFEMRYRTMMFDIANADDSFGYVHTDQSGRIGSIGTLCKVVDRVLQPDGQQYIFLEGISRFRVTKILKTLPYVLAEIEPELADLVPDETAARKLESEVYSALKYYMRLIRSYDNSNKGLVISAAAKKSRPSFVGTSSDYAARRTDFSFALANMIQMSEVIASQLLLQTTNVLRRLEAEKAILVQASEAISEQLISNGLLTAAEDENLKFKAFNTDDDDDILPLDIVREDDVKVKDEWDLSNME